MSALCAATSVLITVHPQMLDVMSMSQFLLHDRRPDGGRREAGGRTSYDWMRYLVTRFEPNDGPQGQMTGFMRAIFGNRLLQNAMVKSTAISDAGMTKQTLYEVDRSQFTRGTYDRALDRYRWSMERSSSSFMRLGQQIAMARQRIFSKLAITNPMSCPRTAPY